MSEKRRKHLPVKLYSREEQFIVPHKATWVWCARCGAIRAPEASKAAARRWCSPNKKAT